MLALNQNSSNLDNESKNSALDYAIDIVNLSKSFQRRTLSKGSYTSIKSALLGAFRQKTRPQVVTRVLEDLTLRIPRGSSVGLIGKNGSGKSTFLKLITGIYKPDSGQIKINGRIAALIELGAGFHPDFSGRENLFLGGVMHGLSRAQIEERFEEIVKFAELEHVIDDPVRTYSSGMFMRLGFSLAVHTDPDILLVDEVLAVGDATFVGKCKERIAQLRREGKTLVLVTHDLDAVERWCDEALWLHEGAVRDRGDPRRVIDHYRQMVEHQEELELLEQAQLDAHSHTQNDAKSEQLESNTAEPQKEEETLRWGSREVEIVSCRLLNQANEEHLLFHPEDSLTIELKYKVNEEVSDCVFGVCFTKSDGLIIHGSNTDIERISVPQLRLSDTGIVRYKIRRIGFLDGRYRLDVAAHRSDGYPFDYHKGALHFAIRSSENQVGVCVPDHTWEIIK